MPRPMDEAKEIDRAPIFWQHQTGTEAGESDGCDKELENAPQRAPFLRELDSLQEKYASLLSEHRQLKEQLQNGKQPAIYNGTPQPKNAPEGLANAPARIIGDSAALRAVLKNVETVAPTRATVLIQGETGTGKELIALTLHGLSQRKEKALIRINCAAIPSALLESDLFGHEKGSFTGAHARKIGRIQLADEGTLFLDEVADIPLEMQPKLLRVLQEQEFERVGGLQSHSVNVRLVAATSRDLGQMVAERLFRSDLYYRLNVFPVRVPSLRERTEDIPALAQHFVAKYADQLGKQTKTIPPEVMKALQDYWWPGNVRELQNFIERSVILSSGKTLNAPVAELTGTGPCAGPSVGRCPITLAECEREHILTSLHSTRWLIGGPHGAAKRLGLKRTTLLFKMAKLGIARQ